MLPLAAGDGRAAAGRGRPLRGRARCGHVADMPSAALSVSTAALVLANLLPLAGALAGIWDTYDVIGAWTLVRMGAVGVLRREAGWVVLMAFFVVHYGMFTFVHGTFVVGMFGPPGERELEEAVFLLLLEPAGLLWPLLGLAASHGVSFLVNFLSGGEWRAAGAGLMLAPYPRVVVLHLVLIVGCSRARRWRRSACWSR